MSLSGYLNGVYIDAPGTTTGIISNFATITAGADSVGVLLDGAGLINGGSNATAALIDRKSRVAVYNAGGSLTRANYGQITSGDAIDRAARR